MRIVSVSENQKIEKRIAITPDIAKKYITLGFEVILAEEYGEHLGFQDNDYKDLGVEFLKKESEAQLFFNKTAKTTKKQNGQRRRCCRKETSHRHQTCCR